MHSSIALLLVAATVADAYTIGQVAAGQTAGGIITGVDYGHGLVTGYGALGAGRSSSIYPGVHHNYAAIPATYGNFPYSPYQFGRKRRSAEAEPWTVGQVLAGVPLAKAASEHRAPGVITNLGLTHYTPAVHHSYAAVPATYGALTHITPTALHGYAAVPATYGNFPYSPYQFGRKKRSAEAEPWTVGQVLAGVPLAKAAAEHRAPGVITNLGLTHYTPAVHHGYAAVPVPATYGALTHVTPTVHHGYGAVPATYGNFPYSSYPYGTFGRKRRSAEAEPWTVGQVLAGVPLEKAASEHRAPGVITNLAYAAVPVPATYGALTHVTPTVHHDFAAVPATYGNFPYSAPFGFTHPSNLGICTNYLGTQVPC